MMWPNKAIGVATARLPDLCAGALLVLSSARQREVVLRLVSIAPARRAALEPGFCTHIDEI